MLRQYIRKLVRAESGLERSASEVRDGPTAGRIAAAPSVLLVIVPLMVLFFGTIGVGIDVLTTNLSLERGAALAVSFTVATIALMTVGVRIMIIWGDEKSALKMLPRSER